MTTLASTEIRWAADHLVHHCGYKSAVLAGVVPDSRHLARGGFHCSVEDLRAHGNGSDYSNSRANDKNFNPQYAAAIDLGLAKADMIVAHGRVRAVWADKTDPRRRYINAINCWPGSGDATRYDFDAGTAKYASPDHRTHTHSEIHRRWVRDAKAMRALVSIYSGESKTAWTAREEPTVKPAAVEDDTMSLTTDDIKKIPPAFRNFAALSDTDIGKIANLVQAKMSPGLAALNAAMAQLAGRDVVDEQAIVTGILAGLTPEQAGAIPEATAQRVVELLTARLQA